MSKCKVSRARLNGKEEKRLGEDVWDRKLMQLLMMVEMYRIFQFFVLGLKIDIFTEFFVSLFYVIQLGLQADAVDWEMAIQIAVTILIIPALYFARFAGSRESHGQMITFITFEAVVIVHYGLILKQTLQPTNMWYTWICLVIIGILLDIVSTIPLSLFPRA